MKSILLLILLMPIIGIAQKKNTKEKQLTEKQKDAMMDSIPFKDDKILYDEIVIADPTMTRSQLYVKIRQWFVENFFDSKAVLEVSDSVNGLLTGKGTYKYQKISGLNYRNGYVQFILNASVKDGKFRYQLYHFTAYGENQSLLSDSPHGYTEEVDLDGIADLYKQGKRKGYCRTYLDGLVGLVYKVKTSLNDLSKSTASISDF